jgi:hypothetical protein
MTVVVWLVAFPSQSLAAGCRSFETSSSGHPSRVGAIQIRGTDCKTASSLIRDFDAAVARSGGPVGSHLYVDDWRCVVLRPYLPTQFTSATDGECLRAKERVDWIDTEQIPTPSIRFYSLFGVLEGLKRLPATIVIGADGNGAITGLIRWQGWGDASARATGTLHQNNCVPSCAQGLIGLRVCAKLRSTLLPADAHRSTCAATTNGSSRPHALYGLAALTIGHRKSTSPTPRRLRHRGRAGRQSAVVVTTKPAGGALAIQQGFDPSLPGRESDVLRSQHRGRASPTARMPL